MDKLSVSSEPSVDSTAVHVAASLEAYLRALRITDEEVIKRCIQEIRDELGIQYDPKGDLDHLQSVAFEVLFRRLVSWYRSVLQLEPSLDAESVLHLGRLTMIVAKLEPADQARFLQQSGPDTDLSKKMQSAFAMTAPGAGESVLQPEPLQFGTLPKLANVTLNELDRKPAIRTALVWLCAVSFFTVLFLMTR